MSWRRLRADEIDHELLWLSVSLGALLVAWLWVRLGLPGPPCPFHEITGWACPGCGATRCVRFVFRGALVPAFLVNPLAFTAFVGIALFDLYAAAVLALRLPRWRLEPVPVRVSGALRLGCAGLVVGNWLWLLSTGV